MTTLSSVPTTVDEIRNTVDEVFKKVRQLPLEEMIKDVSATLKETRDLLKSDDTKKSLAALSKSLQETQKLLSTLNRQVGPLLINVNGTVMETRLTLQTFNKQMLPVLNATEQSLTAATLTLNDSQQTLNAVETLASPDSPLGQALLGIRDASLSVKDLSDSLDRQPDAIIWGYSR